MPIRGRISIDPSVRSASQALRATQAGARGVDLVVNQGELMFTTLLPKTNGAAEAETFVDRAFALVAFLVERHGKGDAMRAREQDLADWIASRRESGSAAHFVATELGIILRALSGPTGIGPRAIRSASVSPSTSSMTSARTWGPAPAGPSSTP